MMAITITKTTARESRAIYLTASRRGEAITVNGSLAYDDYSDYVVVLCFNNFH